MEKSYGIHGGEMGNAYRILVGKLQTKEKTALDT
jgi:hypothetical protein